MQRMLFLCMRITGQYNMTYMHADSANYRSVSRDDNKSNCRREETHCQRHNGPSVLTIDSITRINISVRIVQNSSGISLIVCKFSHQMAPLTLHWSPFALIENRVTQWHHLQSFKIWSLGHFSSKGPKLATMLSHLHCHVSLECPFGIIGIVLNFFLHQP